MPGREATLALAEGAEEAVLAAVAEALPGACGQALGEPFALEELVGGARPALSLEVVPPTGKELRALTPTLKDSRALVLPLVARLNDCARELAKKQEMLALRAEVAFGGGSSQRSSALGIGGRAGGGPDGKGPAEEKREDERPDDGEPGERAEGGTGKREAGEKAPGEKREAGEKAPSEKREAGERPDDVRAGGQPRRHEGCASKATEGMVKATLRKAIDPEALEALRREGRLRRLPDGRYRTIVPIASLVEVEVFFERWLDEATGEIHAADSASESKPVPGSEVSSGLLARTLYLRYVMMMPATRVSALYATEGLGLTKQRIYRLCTQLGLSLSRPLVNRMHGMLLASGAIQADESWVKVREEKRAGRENAVVWLVRTSELLGIPPVVVLTYTCSREAAAFAKVIRGFAGTLMADCYSGYRKLLCEFADEIELVACLQHGRSNFADVTKALRGARSKMTREQWEGLPANRVLALFGKVFEAESKSPPDVEGRRAHRASAVRPALDALFEEIDRQHARLRERDGGKLAQAIRYAVSNRELFYRACDNPLVPLTNSACEREFANLGVARSASHQWDTVLGAVTFCGWFGVARTARANGADELCYLQFILERAVPALREHGDWHWFGAKSLRGGYDAIELPEYGDLSYLDPYMPWSDEFRAYQESWPEERRGTLATVAAALDLAV